MTTQQLQDKIKHIDTQIEILHTIEWAVSYCVHQLVNKLVSFSDHISQQPDEQKRLRHTEYVQLRERAIKQLSDIVNQTQLQSNALKQSRKLMKKQLEDDNTAKARMQSALFNPLEGTSMDKLEDLLADEKQLFEASKKAAQLHADAAKKITDEMVKRLQIKIAKP